LDERVQLLEAQMAGEAYRLQQLQQQLLAQQSGTVTVVHESTLRSSTQAHQRSSVKPITVAIDKATLRNPGRIRPVNGVSKLPRKRTAATAGAPQSACKGSSASNAVSDSGTAILRAHLVHDYLVFKQQRLQNQKCMPSHSNSSSSSRKRRSSGTTAATTDDSSTLQQQCDFTEACVMIEALWSQLGVPQRDRALFRTLHFAVPTFENMQQVSSYLSIGH
jgi:hypothetical protein